MKLRLILGDQLNIHHPWFNKVNDDVCYVLMEMRQETDYAPHHIQKVVAFFGAMRTFASQLKAQGHTVIYLALDHKENRQTLNDNLLHLIDKISATSFEYQLPDEYRLDQQLSNFCEAIQLPTHAEDTHHFMTKREDLSQFFEGEKTIDFRVLLPQHAKTIRPTHATRSARGGTMELR